MFMFKLDVIIEMSRSHLKISNCLYPSPWSQRSGGGHPACIEITPVCVSFGCRKNGQDALSTGGSQGHVRIGRQELGSGERVRNGFKGLEQRAEYCDGWTG